MPQMNTSQARVQDPILTAVARGYVSQKAAVANILFPIVRTGVRAGRIIKFNGDSFKLMSTARAPGAATKRVQFGYSSETYSLVDYRLEGAVPTELMEEAAAVPGLDLGASAIRQVQDIIALERENKAATLARNASNYGAGSKATLSGTDQWSNAASNPFTVIETAKQAIRSQTGERPNVLVLGPKVLSALRVHDKVLSRLSTASDRNPATLAQLAALFEIDQIVEGGAVYQTDAGAIADVWGKDAILAYSTPRSMQEMGSPSFGYTYQLTDRPMVEEAYFGNNESTWYYPYTDAYQPVIAGSVAGYIIKDAVA